MPAYDTIILASQSPRRRDILRRHGIEPIILPADLDETLPPDIGMAEAVRHLALAKAEACAAICDRSALSGRSLIVAADTIVYKNEILGKPQDPDDATRMLRALRGTTHEVATGVALLDLSDGRTHVFHEVTEVVCKDYSDEEIADYIRREQPFDKAGAYAIQGSFREHIACFRGDYENVVGFPFERFAKELERFGDAGSF